MNFTIGCQYLLCGRGFALIPEAIRGAFPFTPGVTTVATHRVKRALAKPSRRRTPLVVVDGPPHARDGVRAMRVLSCKPVHKSLT